nr:AMP-binding protein [Algoriphagus sp.]
MKEPNLTDFEKLYQHFDWQNERNLLAGLPGKKGLNIAHEAVDRHASSHLENTVAIRFIGKEEKTDDYSFGDLKIQTSKFANLLDGLKLKEGDRVFSLLGRVPDLYIAALGALKYKAVFALCSQFLGQNLFFKD